MILTTVVQWNKKKVYKNKRHLFGGNEIKSFTICRRKLLENETILF